MQVVLNLLRGKEYIAEVKFDGERIQLHRDGDKARLPCVAWALPTCANSLTLVHCLPDQLFYATDE